MAGDEWEDAVTQFKREEKSKVKPAGQPSAKSSTSPRAPGTEDLSHSAQVVENKPGDLFRPANEIYEKDAEKTFDETVRKKPVSPWRQWDK